MTRLFVTQGAELAKELFCGRPDVRPHLVDVTPLFVDYYGRQTFGESTGVVILRRDDCLASPVDEAPFACGLNGGQALIESIGIVVLRGNDHMAGFVDEAPFLANRNASEPFGEAAPVVWSGMSTSPVLPIKPNFLPTPVPTPTPASPSTNGAA